MHILNQEKDIYTDEEENYLKPKYQDTIDDFSELSAFPDLLYMCFVLVA